MKIRKGMARVLMVIFLILSGTSVAQREDSQEDIREDQIRERNEERRSSLLEHFQIIRWIRRKKSAAELKERKQEEQQKKERALTETDQWETDKMIEMIEEDENEMP